MKKVRMASICVLSVGALVASAQAATSFINRGDADLTAKWEIWTFGDPPPALGTTGSQGPAQNVQANPSTSLNSSNLQTTITDEYEFPGGFLGNPDTYYLHTGGATWDLSAEISNPTDYLRISYSLLGFGGNAATNFTATPSGLGLTEINSGSYNEGIGVVYFYEFELDSPSDQIEVSFGDVIFPGFPGSFRSIDAVQIETFTGEGPLAIPEPSSAILLAGGMFALSLRRRC